MIDSCAVNDMSYVKCWTLYYIVCQGAIPREIATLFEGQLINMDIMWFSATKLPFIPSGYLLTNSLLEDTVKHFVKGIFA